MLTLTEITKSYSTPEIETRALDAVSLEVAEGEFLAVMGPSGCGKSTLLNVLGLLDRPTQGSYRLSGSEVIGLPSAKLARLRGEHIAFVFQNFNLIDDLTVAENVEVSLLYRRGSAAAKDRIGLVLDQVGMTHRANHRPQQLSGGQQQRVAIARALASNPSLILADEPTGNLDSANGEQVIELLQQVARSGTSVVMVTHSHRDAAAAQRIVQMLDGRIVGETRL
ncbi:ABC transporter ATP-binding protein [Sphingomonas sp. JC676]|uniref:ABC transporter ATP-binding protein n=1 Tax=Sphingomonas sp. JC676 TaxID=2768065 RepID=UPI001657B99B|nr:ABC transporter ATP-binding protein [Sphingomonas sp. JC676]MBC9035135.1 ABC transporter ATP-binding protein [Sphingomonas sp. JC676]